MKATNIMLHLRVSFLVLVLAGGCDSGPKPLFRHIDISPRGRIELGTSFISVDAAVQLSDTSWALKDGSFGGADSILVITDAAGEVIALHFRYALAETFDSKQKAFEEYLGPATGGHPAPGGTLIVFWEDSITRFELRDPPPRLGGPVRAAMLDRHYYVD